MKDDHLFTLAVSSAPWFCEFGQLVGLWNCPTGYELPSKEAVLFPSQVIFLGGTLFIQGMWDGLILQCLAEEEITSIISHCHDKPSGGHASGDQTAAKILQVGLYWPTLFNDVHAYV